MTSGKLSIACTSLFALLASQLTLADALQAAPARRGVPSLATAKKQESQAEAIRRPVRPEGVDTHTPVAGEEIFIERYDDGSVRIEREVALDEEGNYVNHGPYRMWTRDGKLIAEGDYEMGARVGIWTRWADRKESPLLSQTPFKSFKAPFLSQLGFINGVADGEWLIFDADQRKVSQISLVDGTRHGLALLWAPDGTLLRQSSFENGLPQGDVLQMNAGTKKLDRVKIFLDGREMVTKKATFPRTQQPKIEANHLAAPTVETESDDFWAIKFAEYKAEGEELKHGEWKTWHANGQLHMRGQYHRDQKVGRFVYWHPNGQIAAEGNFREDQYEGDWVWWHPNGQKAVYGTFRNGQVVDEWRWWDQAGRLTKRSLEDGSMTTQTEENTPLNLGQLPEDDTLTQ